MASWWRSTRGPLASPSTASLTLSLAGALDNSPGLQFWRDLVPGTVADPIEWTQKEEEERPVTQTLQVLSPTEPMQDDTARGLVAAKQAIGNDRDDDVDLAEAPVGVLQGADPWAKAHRMHTPPPRPCKEPRRSPPESPLVLLQNLGASPSTPQFPLANLGGGDGGGGSDLQAVLLAAIGGMQSAITQEIRAASDLSTARHEAQQAWNAEAERRMGLAQASAENASSSAAILREQMLALRARVDRLEAAPAL